MATPLDSIVIPALRAVGAVAMGEVPEPEKANDAFNLLNDLLDGMSNEPGMLFAKQEVIHELTPGQYVYTIGPGGSVGATFTGTIAANSSTLNVTAIASGALSVGQAVAGAFASSGQVATLNTLTQGLGYFTNPTLSAIGGGGSGAAATSTLTMIGVADLWNPGVGYVGGDIVTVNGGTFSRPATILVINPGFQYQVLDGGAYTVVPGTPVTLGTGLHVTGNGGTVTVTGGSGTGLQPRVCWGLGAPVLTNPGANYASPPTFSPSGGTPNTAGTYVATLATATAGVVAAGTVITSYGTAQGGNGISALGTYMLNLSQPGGGPATLTSYAPRPLRINSGFARIPTSSGNLDFPIDIVNVAQYQNIGLKQLNGPWPRAVYYQPTEPLGVLTYWPNPSGASEMHLFCDMLMNRFQTLSDTITLPQGYNLAFQWILAEALIPRYPSTGAAAEVRSMIPAFAARARAYIKRTNQRPIQEVQFDPMLVPSRVNDASWILHGGFNS